MARRTTGRGVEGLVPGTKLATLYDFLRKVIKGTDQMVFTIENAREAAKALELKAPEQVWNMLQNLERKGLVGRKRRTGEGRGAGMFVWLKSKGARAEHGGKPQKKKAHHPGSISVDQLMGRIKADVSELEEQKRILDKKIEHKQNLYVQLEEVLKATR